MSDTDNPNRTDPVKQMTEAALAAIDKVFDERCADICHRREMGELDIDMFLAELREVEEARDRVKATIVPQTWDGTFTDGREP